METIARSSEQYAGAQGQSYIEEKRRRDPGGHKRYEVTLQNPGGHKRYEVTLQNKYRLSIPKTSLWQGGRGIFSRKATGEECTNSNGHPEGWPSITHC